MSLDVIKARDRMLKKERQALDFLLKYRSSFFTDNIPEEGVVLDIGTGIGYLNVYVKKKIFLTDIEKNGWIDFVSDAHHLPMKRNSIDIVILNNVLHHFSSPWKVLQEIRNILKDDGTVLIYDVTLSTIHKFLIVSGISKEQYDTTFNIFSPDAVSKNPWMGNNAIPDLLFDKPSAMEELGFKMQKREYCEFLLFLTSGGITNIFPVPDFHNLFSRIFSFIDATLVKLFPKIFSLQQRVILKKL